jgi:hypothetical protein
MCPIDVDLHFPIRWLMLLLTTTLPSFARPLLQTRTLDEQRKRSEIFRAGPVPQLPFSATAFDKLVRGCKLPRQILEMHYCHSNAGCGSKFALRDESSGKISVLSTLVLILPLSPDLVVT